MKVEDLNKSKAYKKLNMSDVEKSELLEMCKSKKKELKSDIPDLSIRRTEKVNKDDKNSIIKKVVFAAGSIVATIAIVAGVAKYNNELEKNEKGVAKETVEVTTDNGTKYIEDEFVVDKNENLDYDVLFDENRLIELMSNKGKITIDGYDFDYKTVNGTNPKVSVIGATLGYENYDTALLVKEKNETEYTEVPNAEEGIGNTLSNGESLIYFGVDSSLCKYNMKTKKYYKVKIDCDTEGRKDFSKKYSKILGCVDGKVYMNIVYADFVGSYSDGEDHNIKSYICMYNILTNELTCIRKDREIIYCLGKYLITATRFSDSNTVDTSSLYNQLSCYVEKITEEGLEEVAFMGEHSDCLNYDDYDGRYIFFESMKPLDECNEDYDYTEKTIKVFDKESGKVSKLATIKSEDFGHVDSGLSIEKININNCTVRVGYDDYYKYTFATKDIKKINK